jgi:hypothetical protein
MTIRASWLIWRFDWNDALWFEKSVNRLTPPPPFSIQQTTNPLGQQTSCSSCLIAPVSKSHPRPCHAPLQHPRRMISALKIGFTYIVKCAGSIRRRGRESQSRVPFRTGDGKSLCWRSVCVSERARRAIQSSRR